MFSFVNFEKMSRMITALPRRNRQQLLASIIWLVLALFCAAALGHYYGQQKAAATARDRAEAEAAAALLAGQSLERIVAGDRISVQLLAQQMLKLRAISGIAVQDVESNTLAQVGDTERGESVSAPVVLHDSIAGNVSVNLLPGSGVHFPWASLLLCLVFALPFSAACALAAGGVSSRLAAGAPPPAAGVARRKLPVVGAGPVSAPIAQPEITVGLYLRPLNWAQLGNQLSRSALDKVQGELEQRLQLLRRIYDARPLAHAGPQQGLGFCGEDAAFRAVCCGLLLRELLGSRASGLQLALAVVPAKPDTFDFSGEQLLTQARGLSLHSQLLEEASLDGRIEHHGTSWGAEVTGLMPAYQKLLENQLHQLLKA